MHELLVLADPRKCKQVFVQNAIAVIAQCRFSMVGICEDGWIGAINHQTFDVLANFAPTFGGSDFRDGKRPHLSMDKTANGAFFDAFGKFK